MEKNMLQINGMAPSALKYMFISDSFVVFIEDLLYTRHLTI